MDPQTIEIIVGAVVGFLVFLWLLNNNGEQK